MILQKQTKYSAYTRNSLMVFGLLSMAACLMLTAGCGGRTWATYATNNNPQTAKRFIVEGKGLDATDALRDTPFLWAARNGHADTVQFLIGEKVDINEANKTTGETALILAVKENHLEIVDLLMNHRANNNIRDHTGYSALDWASQQGNRDILPIVMGTPSGDVVNSEEGNPVVAAVYSGELGIVQSLVQKGYSVNDPDAYGDTPYIAAVETGAVKIATFLQEQGADIHVTDGLGRSPLMLAAQAGHVDLASHLIGEGADLNGVSNHGHTLLMFASANGHDDMVDYLLEKGADPNQLDADQRSALFLAAARGQWHITKLLLRRGAMTSLGKIRAEDKRPYLMAPMYEIAGEFYLEKNNKEKAVEFFELGKKTFTDMSKEFSLYTGVSI